MNPLLATFVPEARDLLQQASDGLLRLERDPADAAVIAQVFRAVHTLKGSSGLFDAIALTRVVHVGEDLLDAVRDGRLSLTAAMVDRLLDSLDQVGAWIGALEQTERLPDDADAVAATLVAGLRAQFSVDPATSAQADGPAEPAEPLWRDLLDPSQRAIAVAAGADALAICYRPDEGCFYRGEDPLNLFRDLPDLISLHIAPRTPWPAIAELNPYACNLVFHAVTTAPRATVEHLFRYVADEVRIAPVTDHRQNTETEETAAALAIRVVENQRQILLLPADTAQLHQRIAAVTMVIGNLLDGQDLPITRDELREAAARSEKAASAAPLLALLNRIVTPPAARPPGRAIKPPQSDAAGVLHVLKVDADRVDRLMNLIGELVVAKNALPFLARAAEDQHGNRAIARAIKDQYAVFDRLTQEMQGAITQIRMLPVSEAFARFPRLVRDIARKLGKSVALVIEGEETAADKTIIEAIGDPLLHIIRNALDHGIEPPDMREAAGKPQQGTLRLTASQEADQVVIVVSDDGAGIDPARIRRSAVDKGIISAADAERLSDQEAIELIFRPGFSTAAEISDISGRGVGMDVVRSTADRLGGTATVTSRPGEGSIFQLSLPLSMAITRVMMVEAGGTLFGIPMDVIAETVRVGGDRIRTIKQAETFVLRDTVVPLLRLTRLLGIRAPEIEAEAAAVLVVRVAGQLAGLVVDRFREGMDVILKPMEGVLAGIAGYAGTALLGDGRVLLVLNLRELL
jgi:two-component system, chemotaxis family, sensor kinase CheA